MTVVEFVGMVLSILNQLGLLTAIQAVVVLMVAVALVNYLVRR